MNAQTLVVRVRDAASGQWLHNAEVIDRTSGRRWFTSIQGDASVPAAQGARELRIRQIGYTYVDTTVSPGTDALDISLKRVAYDLPTEKIVERNECGEAADPTSRAVAALALEQLQAAAERYESFRGKYPFNVTLERYTKWFDAKGTPTRQDSRDERTTSEDWGERYVRGAVVERSGRVTGPSGFSALILFLSNLAEPEFWRAHCFEVRGMENVHDTPAVRLAFWPATSVKTPDWSGAALLDSATSELRRIEFSLVGGRSGERPARLEGYTTFRSPTPNIVLPDSTLAAWWYVRTTDRPDMFQMLRVKEIKYNRARP